MEEWKEVEGFEGKYKVSSYGRVWNTHKDVEVSQPLSGDPQYKYVNLHFTGRKSQFLRTHIVVAKTFIDNPDNLPIVDHIDRDKMNNHVSNLRWTDHSGNQRNKEGSVYVRGLHLLDFVKKYESPYAAYQHILSRTGSPKYWYECFGLDYKKTKAKKDRLKCSFEEVLKHCGVDLTGKSISYTD